MTALERETEMGAIAGRVTGGISNPRVQAIAEQAARDALAAYRECYELVRYLARRCADPSDTSYDPGLATLAQAALEAAR